jgi:hypothetical protein
MLRFLTAGESHGKGLVAILEGVPAGLVLDFDAITVQLRRRQGGYGRRAYPLRPAPAPGTASRSPPRDRKWRRYAGGSVSEEVRLALETSTARLYFAISARFQLMTTVIGATAAVAVGTLARNFLAAR